VEDEQQRRIRARTADAARLRAPVEDHPETMRDRVAPVLVRHFRARGREPGAVLHLEIFVDAAGEEARAAQRREAVPDRDEAAHEFREPLSLFADSLPVVPGDLVVLAISVVVAALGSAELIAA